MTASKPLIVGIGGTNSSHSSTELALRCALQSAQNEGAETALFSGELLNLPHFSPKTSDRDERVQTMVEALRRCDGLIIASPGYHGGISGLVKNALDYTEDLRGDARVYLEGRGVGVIACAAGWQAAGATLAALRAVTHALRGWPTPMGVMINSSTKQFDELGNCLDSAVSAQLQLMGAQVVDFARKSTQHSLATC